MYYNGQNKTFFRRAKFASQRVPYETSIFYKNIEQAFWCIISLLNFVCISHYQFVRKQKYNFHYFHYKAFRLLLSLVNSLTKSLVQ